MEFMIRDDIFKPKLGNTKLETQQIYPETVADSGGT